MATIAATAAGLRARRHLLVTAWVITLLVSTLPEILLIELAGGLPTWLGWARLVVLALAVAATFAWPAVRPLRAYFLLFATLFVAERLRGWFAVTPTWQGWFGGQDAGFVTQMMGEQLLRLVPALIMIGALLALGFRRPQFFLVKGDTRAPAGRVRWLGIDEGTSWLKLGSVLAVCISLGLFVFLVIAGRPALGSLAAVLPLLPAVLLFAAMNAFSEEMTYRASFLAPLEGVVGKEQSLLLTAAIFGLGHFYGVPYGVLGVLMAGLLGWLLGKSMLETRGFAWAWFIHFCQDVLIFAFIAVGSIVPGG